MSNTILRVEHLTKVFDAGDRLIGRSRGGVRAVDDISFIVEEGEIFAIVGESGCGKTTTARLILRLIEATAGKVYFRDTDLFSLAPEEMRRYRRNMQMIFQDPYSSLNPRWLIRDILAEPLVTHNIGTPTERAKMVDDILKTVGLPPESTQKYAHQFSGGQRQRIGIARALITRPEFVICDEPISALDVSIQAQIINLLKELQQKFNLTYLFITHDLRVVRFLCDKIGIMYLGKLVEAGLTEKIFVDPLHPYTQALFSAIPVPDPTAQKNEILLGGDVPSPLNPPSGCRFRTRCRHVMPICSEEMPVLSEMGSGHRCACHLYPKTEKQQKN